MASHIAVTLEHNLNQRYVRIKHGAGRRAAVVYGRFYLRFRQDGKRIRVPLDAQNLETALLQRSEKEESLNAVVEAKASDSHSLSAEIKTYLDNCKKLAPKSYASYKMSLESFQKSCRKSRVDDVSKQDLQAFDSLLLKQGNDDRTRHNRVSHVVTFLRNKEGRREGKPIVDVSIKIKYVEAPPEAYTRQELTDLFAASDDDEKFLWRLFLGSGFRECEVSVAESTDLNLDTRTISVAEKTYFGFRPKDCEKRSIPISDALIAEIKQRKKSGSCSLLFGNYGRPDGHLLRILKEVAFAGGLNCGKCVGRLNGKDVSCSDAPVCEKWILHRMRKNFATDRHEAGASARQIQKWLGHSSIETTLRYLAVGDDTRAEVREICNAVYAGL